MKRLPSGRYDFVLTDRGDLERTPGPVPSILRLLTQGTWVGDNGERAGQSLNDIKLLNTSTPEQARQIVDTRLGVLVRRGDLASAEMTAARVKDNRLDVEIEVSQPGQAPVSVSVQLQK